MTETIQALIDSFRTEAEAHSRATDSGDYRAANKAAARVHGLFRQLVDCDNDGRAALLELAETAESGVAIMAASYSLRFNPQRALRVLKRLRTDRGIVGFQAEQAMKRWKSGEWKLE